MGKNNRMKKVEDKVKKKESEGIQNEKKYGDAVERLRENERKKGEI